MHAARKRTPGPRLTGTLVRLKTEGYGFIRPDDGTPDYYVSISSMRDRADWVEGTRVQFTPGKPFPVRAGEKSKATPAFEVVAAHDVRTIDARNDAARKLTPSAPVITA